MTENFSIQTVLKQGGALTPLLFNSTLPKAIREGQETGWN
jgi:hypothetical protein